MLSPRPRARSKKNGQWPVNAHFANDDGFKDAAATTVLSCGNLAQKKEESPIRGKEGDRPNLRHGFGMGDDLARMGYRHEPPFRLLIRRCPEIIGKAVDRHASFLRHRTNEIVSGRSRGSQRRTVPGSARGANELN
jgi:hypothetical protein